MLVGGYQINKAIHDLLFIANNLLSTPFHEQDMVAEVFDKLAYDSLSEFIFGVAKSPLRYGFGLEVGAGSVVPELKYFPKPENLRGKTDAIASFRKITEEALTHAVNLGMEAVQLETEFPDIMTRNPDWGAETTREQLALMEKFHDENGIKIGYRATLADIRNVMEKGGLRGESHDLLLSAFEANVDAGAHLVSIESFGGKEIISEAITHGNIAGAIFATGILGTRDVRFLWKGIVSTCGSKAIPAGDSACAHGNSTMMLAKGMHNQIISHVYAATVRAICAVRSLAAYEAGAIGPGKDCGYENVYMKAITGYPMSFEGKSSAGAHSSLVGNIAMAVPDLWSNESIEHVKLFSGMAPNVFLEMLHYDCQLMNSALKLGTASSLQAAIIDSNSLNDPQALVLTPENAFRISKAIVAVKGDYQRSIAGAKEALVIIEEHQVELKLARNEQKYLQRLEKEIEALPDDESVFVERINEKYSNIMEFIPKDYDM